MVIKAGVPGGLALQAATAIPAKINIPANIMDNLDLLIPWFRDQNGKWDNTAHSLFLWFIG